MISLAVPRLRLGDARPGMVLVCGLAAVAAIGAASSAALQPGNDRLLAAALLYVVLVGAAVPSPRLSIGLTIGMLPFLALMRRLLIFDAGWSTTDPLVLVAPAVAVTLVIQALFMRRSLPRDLLSRLIGAYLLLTLFEVLNPAGGGLLANMQGLLFVAAPLLWFYLGQELANRRLMVVVLSVVVVEACVQSVYGLSQTLSGLAPWDAEWARVAFTAGYTSLNVNGQLRAFGSFSGAAEYAVFLTIAIAICLASPRAVRIALLPVVALVGTAIFYESARGAVILALLAALVVAALRSGNGRRAVGITVAGTASAIILTYAFGSSLAASTTSAGNPLLIHQVSGLTDPFNPDQSSLLGHLQLVRQGFQTGIAHPLGSGPAASNIAGNRDGVATQGTEIDLSNVFVNDGLLGGVLYLIVVVLALRRVFTFSLRSRDAIALCVVAVMISAFGQWLNGGLYAIAPVVWLCIGWVNREASAIDPGVKDQMGISLPG